MFHHCRIWVTDFREGGVFPPSHPWAAPKKPILNTVKAIEIRTSMVSNLDFHNNSTLLLFSFFFLIIDLYFLTPVVIAQIFILTAELLIPTENKLMKQMHKLKHNCWLYLMIMSPNHFRVNLHSTVAWMWRNSLLKTGAISELFNWQQQYSTINKFVKESARLWAKWLWVRISLLSLKNFRYCACFEQGAPWHSTAHKMIFFIKGFFSKYEKIHRKLRMWSHLLEKSLIKNFNFYAVFKQL